MYADYLPLLFSTLAFAAGHFLMSSAPIRGPVVAAIGNGPFRAVYSLLMIAALAWMIGAYNSAPYYRLWDVGLLGPPVILILMYFAVFF
jgi:uncharacterized membrane protein